MTIRGPIRPGRLLSSINLEMHFGGEHNTLSSRASGKSHPIFTSDFVSRLLTLPQFLQPFEPVRFKSALSIDLLPYLLIHDAGQLPRL